MGISDAEEKRGRKRMAMLMMHVVTSDNGNRAGKSSTVVVSTARV